MNKEKIKIGVSDYSREQMENDAYGWGTTGPEFLDTIEEYERIGYQVKFETNWLRRIFAIGIYKITAYK